MPKRLVAHPTDRAAGITASARTGDTPGNEAPLTAEELEALHGWLRARNVTPRLGDRPAERDAALRQWAAVAIEGYAMRRNDPRTSIAALRRLWRESAWLFVRVGTRGRVPVRRGHRAGDEPATSTNLRVANIIQMVGPNVYAPSPRDPTGVLYQAHDAVREALRHRAREAKRAAVQALQHAAFELSITVVLPLEREQQDAIAGDPVLASREGWISATELPILARSPWGEAFDTACERATAEITDATAKEARALLDVRAYRVIELLLGVPEGTARRAVHAQRTCQPRRNTRRAGT